MRTAALWASTTSARSSRAGESPTAPGSGAALGRRVGVRPSAPIASASDPLGSSPRDAHRLPPAGLRDPLLAAAEVIVKQVLTTYPGRDYVARGEPPDRLAICHSIGRSVMGLVDRDDGWRIPDWLWERIAPLLPAPPPHPLGCHRPRVPDRDAMDAILLVPRTGMRWNALNATGICTLSSAHRRFQEWEQAGVFAEIWRQGLVEHDTVVGIDWAWLAADGAMTKAPLGGPKTGRIPLIGLKGGEAFGSLRGSRGPDRVGTRRSQPQRPQAPEGHA